MAKTEENSKSIAWKRVNTANGIAFALANFIVDGEGALDEKTKETVKEALVFTEKEDGESIKKFRVCSTGARELAEWMIDCLPSVRYRPLFGKYIRAKLNGHSPTLGRYEKNMFHKALADICYQLGAQVRHIK